MKKLITIFLITGVVIISYSFYSDSPQSSDPTYVGTQGCVCHADKIGTWSKTLHGKAEMYPGPGTVIAPWSGSVSMGSAFGNATVTLSIVGGVYKATLNPSSGTPVTYDVAQTRGSGWKQYYHVKIGNSYYRLPILWTNGSYKNATGGSLVASGQSSWFTATGTLRPIDNTFRKTSFDKGCSGCHLTGNKITVNVTGSDSEWVATWVNNDTMNAKVGCEKCHGPGSDHVAGPTTSNIFGPTRMNAAGITRQQELCGQCHFRGTSTNTKYSWALKESVDSTYQPGTPLSNYIKSPWQNFINATGGPSFWPDSMNSRTDRSEWQELSYSAHSTFLNCYRCHDPHQVTPFEHQLKADQDDNSLCLQCHQNFGHPGDPNITAITSHTKHSYDPENKNQTGGSSRCISCHMTAVATNISNYDIPTHTFKVIRPILTLRYKGVLTATTNGNLNSCAAGCHRNPSSAGGTGNVPNLGVGFDSSFTNWSESTDSLLADTLNRFFNRQNWTISTGVQPISNEVPDKYILNQNYPNPFNPNTKISFSVPRSEVITIRIYDILGQEIYTLVNEKLSPGTYVVNWDSRDSRGGFAPSGVYFYRLIAENYAETKKMMLVR